MSNKIRTEMWGDNCFAVFAEDTEDEVIGTATVEYLRGVAFDFRVEIRPSCRPELYQAALPLLFNFIDERKPA